MSLSLDERRSPSLESEHKERKEMKNEEEPLVHIYTCFYTNEYTCDKRNKNAAERKIMMRERESDSKRGKMYTFI